MIYGGSMNMMAPVITFANGESEDIRRCILALVSIRRGTQPLDREFGMVMDYLDEPIEMAKSMYVVDLTETLARYENRLRITRVEFDGPPEEEEAGTLRPHIYGVIKE